MSKFRDIAIIGKIAIPVVILAMVAISIVLSSTLAVGHLSNMATTLVDRNAARVKLALEAESSFNSAAVSEKNVILSANDAKAANSAIAQYDRATAASLDAISHLAAITDDAAETANIDIFRKAVQDRKNASAHVFELALAGKQDEAFAFSRSVAAEYRRIAMEAVGKLNSTNGDKMEAARLEALAMAARARFLLVGGGILGFMLGFGLIAWIALFHVSRPLRRMTAEMNRLAAGELAIQIEGNERGDEIGDLARSLSVFHDNAVTARRLETEKRQAQLKKEQRQQQVEQHIGEFDTQLRAALDNLTRSSSQLHNAAESMSATATQTSRQAMEVAATSDIASANVQTVAASTEELHSSIDEISRQVGQSASIAGKAVVEADRTSEMILGLAATAQKIGDVVSLIQNIAAQTNLLALNATIEAARAGDAGKGFAVVAAEVKMLANQTARATEEISAQVSAIQSETGHAVEAIKSIGGTIRTMSEYSAAISAAVEQQGAATRDISQNVQAVARGTAEVSSNVAGVNQAADVTGAAASQVLSAADDLGRQSNSLRRDVSVFFEKIRSE
jgi:methyl-accepting chemotaxis protein